MCSLLTFQRRLALLMNRLLTSFLITAKRRTQQLCRIVVKHRMLNLQMQQQALRVLTQQALQK